jgi:hypothetical protein
MTRDHQWLRESREHLFEELKQDGMMDAEARDAAAALGQLAAWRSPDLSADDTALLVQQLSAALPGPPHVLSGIWWHVALSMRVALYQIRLIHRALWIGSALVIAFVTLYAAVIALRYGADALAVVLPAVAAIGCASAYSRETDPALEIASASPASVRLILLSRVLLVSGFDALLALGATVVVAQAHGVDVGSLTMMWIGPMSLLASGSLLLSLLVGPLIAAGSTLAGWFAQVLVVGQDSSVQVMLGSVWRTNPVMLALAALLLVIAILYVPRQERLA